MMYEVEVIRDALRKSDIAQLIRDDPPEEWDRLEAEQIVYFMHRHGFRLISDSHGVSMDD